MPCRAALNLDQALVCALAFKPDRLPEVDHRWLYSDALSQLVRVMQLLHERGERVDFDEIAAEFRAEGQGNGHLPLSGTNWGGWWGEVLPRLRGADVPWPHVRDRARELASHRTAKEQALRAAKAAEDGDLRDVEPRDGAFSGASRAGRKTG